MSTVSIKIAAHFDPRFDSAAVMLGLPSRWDVVGRMIPLWACATEMGNPRIQSHLVVAHFGAQGVEVLTECGLIREHNGRLEVVGYDKHLDWLRKKREYGKLGAKHGVKGGRPKTPNGVSEWGSNKTPNGVPDTNPIQKPHPNSHSHSHSHISGFSESPESGSPVASLGDLEPGSARAPRTDRSKRKPTSSVRPPDLTPTLAHAELARSLGVDLPGEFAKFCDHHDAKGSRFADWDAALRTWLRNAAKFASAPQRSAPASGSAAFIAEVVAEAEAERKRGLL